METQLHTFWEPAGIITGIFVGLIAWAVAKKAIDARFTPEQQERWSLWGFRTGFLVAAFPAYLFMRHEAIWSTVVGGIIFTAPMAFFWAVYMAYRYRSWQLRRKK